MVHYAGETPVAVLEEPSNSWERDSVNGDEAAGEARGQEGPAQTATLEETMQALLRPSCRPCIPALPNTLPDDRALIHRATGYSREWAVLSS